LGLEPRPDAGLLDRARTIRNHLDDEVYHEIGTDNQYAQKIHDQRLKILGSFYEAVKRVCVFHAFDAMAVEKAPCLEVLFETLWLLEEKVYGTPKSLVPRTGEIHVGEQINLKGFLSLYESNKRQAVQEVTLRVENAVKELIIEPALPSRPRT